VPAGSDVGTDEIWESLAMRRLLLVDPGDGAVLSDLDDGTRVRLGPSRGPGPAERTRTAVWSAAGRWAAWAVESGEARGVPEGDEVQEVRLFPPGADEPRVLASALTAFYLNPSPCGRYLSHLSPGPLGLELAVSDVASGELRVIERGQPLFWSWSPDASRLAVHVGDRVLVASREDGTGQLLTDDAGSFMAPWWTPDGSVVFASADRIVSHAADGAVTEVARHPGVGRFSLDPDGRRLAFVDIIEEVPSLVVLDLLTGERDVVAPEPTAGFFWSPEGRRLAALVLAGPGQLQWLVSDGKQVTRLAPFRPCPDWLQEVLPFFEQYAQSHAVWSADGGQLVATALGADGSPEAVVQTVDGPTVRLPGARLAWWAAD
jgi:TolB protein